MDLQESMPSSSRVTRTALLVLRVLTFMSLLIALILIATDREKLVDPQGATLAEVKFSDAHAYRYMISAIAIGFAYNLLQLALSIFNVVTGNRVLSGNGGYLFDFYSDKIISYLLVSGAAAGFGFTEDSRSASDPLNPFYKKADASASFLVIGFVCIAIASIFTSYALPKKAN